MPAAECREHGFVYSVWTSPELSDTIRFLDITDRNYAVSLLG